jgi:GntR family transcriptional repressor for pyruvate dehydrogenase complex
VARLHDFAHRVGSATSIGERVRAHSRFFIEVALASQSERLTRAEVRLQAEFGDLVWTPGDPPFDPAAASGGLGEIAEAIAEERSEPARSCAERHVQGAARWLIGCQMWLNEAHPS